MSQTSSPTMTMEEPFCSSPSDTVVESNAKSEAQLEKGATVYEQEGEYEIVKWEEGEPAK
jgi:hypothetical protein